MQTVLNVPMRNWNSTAASSNFKTQTFWTYLWGIETPSARKLAAEWNTFWTYLWGIETTPFDSCPTVPSHRFERTYEELKRINAAAVLNTFHGFERTYEELKLAVVMLPPPFIVKVLNVPMRNWNYHSPEVTRLKMAVLNVPMRNWNSA